MAGLRLEDDTRLPPELRDPATLAHLALLLTWREGDPPPQPPKTLTIPLPDLLAKLDDPQVRAAVVQWLSKLLPQNRAARRRAARRR